MSTIKLIGHLVGFESLPLFGHLQVVLDNTTEIEVRPDEVSGDFWGFRIDRALEVGVNPQSSISFDLGSRDANDVWQMLKNAAQQIMASGPISYDVFYQNSNTFINTLLSTAGINTSQYLSGMSYNFPAVQYNVINRITFNITGTDGADWFWSGNQNDHLVGGGGDDRFFAAGGDDLLSGDTGNDTLNGDDGNDTIDGGIGNDTILGGSGVDYLFGGAGNDLLTGEAGYDVISGGTDDDVLYGEDGNDSLEGDDGADYLYGGAGEDTLNGGHGADILSGGDGNDTLDGGQGSDSISGGDGADTISYLQSIQGVTVDLSTGTGIGGEAEGDTIVSVENVTGSAFDDYLTGNSGANILTGGAGVDRLIGGAGGDGLFGGSDADALIGGDGSDSLFGGSGSDVLIVGNIDGSASSVSDTETVMGGADADYLILTTGAGGTVTVLGDDDDDLLFIHSSLLGITSGNTSGIGLFQLRGGVYLEAATAVEFGFRGQVGGLMEANLQYDASDPVRIWFYSTKPFTPPTFTTDGLYRGFSLTDPSTDPASVFNPAYSSVPIYEDPSLPFLVMYQLHEATGVLEVLVYSGFGVSGERELLETIVINDFQDGDNGIHLGEVFDPYADVGLGYDPRFVDELDGAIGAGPDYYYHVQLADLTFYANSYDASVIAAYNAEVGYISTQQYSLTSNADVVSQAARFAALGMSSLNAAAGISAVNLIMTITGGVGADTLRGLNTAEKIIGGDGNDALHGMGGNDRLYGGLGDDRIYGGTGADMIDGGAGTDTADYRYSTAGVTVNLATGAGAGGDAAGDQLIGVENITGSGFNDVLTGNDGVNRLVGLDGNDTLSGGAGNDILLGGLGADTLAGGAGDQDAASYQVATAGVIVNLATGGTGGEAAGDTYNGIEYIYAQTSTMRSRAMPPSIA